MEKTLSVRICVARVGYKSMNTQRESREEGDREG